MNNYDNYAQRLSQQIKARFSEIEAIYNFEYGNETEIALCQILTVVLPDKFGVCRGFVISKEGERAGDDIIIYDKMSFPLIRQHSVGDFSLKQQVPIESVYAYIECKNSIRDKSTLEKAIKQVNDVKALLLKRELKPNELYEIDGPIYNGKVRDWPRQEPKYHNQPFTLIFTRDWDESLTLEVSLSQTTPDLLILGEDCLASQHLSMGPDGKKGALFIDHKFWAPLNVEKANGNSFGIGVIMLFQALNKIKLEQIDWYSILNEELSPFRGINI